MYVSCPMCNTRYDLKSSIPTGSSATVICVVCQTQLDVTPRGITRLYSPKVTVRHTPPEEVQDNPAITPTGEDDGQVG